MVRSQRLSNYQNREKGRKNGKETGRKERKKEIDSERVFVLQNRQPKVNCFLKKKATCQNSLSSNSTSKNSFQGSYQMCSDL